MQCLVMSGALGFSNLDSFLVGKIEHGVKVALSNIQKKIETIAGKHESSERQAEMLKSAAQLLLLLDRPEEAAVYFAECVKQVPRQSKGEYNASSCLFTGIQNLYRNHLRLAASCLQRALETKGVSRQIQIESCAALATLFFKLGMRRPANLAINHALELSEHADHKVPHAILEVLRLEFLALNFLRLHPRLSDLAFWPRREELAGEVIRVETVFKEIEKCRVSIGQSELLCARLDFLELIINIAYLKPTSINAAFKHIEQMALAGLTNYAQSARVELAIAGIAAGNEGWVQTSIQPLVAANAKTSSLDDNLEFEYCQAKLAEMHHREDIYIHHYRRYTQAAIVQIRRACAYIQVPHVLRAASQQIPKDDISTRLPGKYRRAYRFLLENICNPNLSVKMVADEIGVTERSLQLTFRAHVGQSPSEVIRQCRMENIRLDLETGATCSSSTLLDVASKWGIRSRSSLGHSYQSAFNETPRQTIDDIHTGFNG